MKNFVVLFMAAGMLLATTSCRWLALAKTAEQADTSDATRAKASDETVDSAPEYCDYRDHGHKFIDPDIFLSDGHFWSDFLEGSVHRHFDAMDMYALYREGEGRYHVAPVRIGPVFEENLCAGMDILLNVVRGNNDYIALLSGLKNYNLDSFAGIEHGARIFPGQNYTVEHGGLLYSFTATADGDDNSCVANYRLYLAREGDGTEQLLTTLECTESIPAIVFMGDVDGEPDLIVDETADNNHYRVLYLSSVAGESEVVRAVAENTDTRDC
ncbi:MAG: hypothetical protein LBH06_06340 [Rikenellaceae bacterium]|jgi:hypothetical protein|nr:hypothetical protein [Rikenellaceae bacterium]